MRAYIPEFDMVQAQSLSDALEHMSGEQPPSPFAGGTDIMVVMAAGKQKPGRYLDLSRCQDLQGISINDGWLRIGALVSYSEIVRSTLVQQHFPNLVRAAQETGAWAIQNRGTIGGNIANASPAADTPPALLVYEAEIELVSKSGSRRIPYSTFHTGYKQTLRQKGELIQAIYLPSQGHDWHYYRKVGTRKAQSISKVCLTATSGPSGLKLAYGSLAPTAVLCPKTAAFIQAQTVWGPAQTAQVREILTEEIAPIDDIRSTKEYRFQVAANILTDLFQSRSSR